MRLNRTLCRFSKRGDTNYRLGIENPTTAPEDRFLLLFPTAPPLPPTPWGGAFRPALVTCYRFTNFNFNFISEFRIQAVRFAHVVVHTHKGVGHETDKT